jgi:hypothetical protein
VILIQAKNYRKPLLQRHVIRILVLVPLFSVASWASLTSLQVAFWIDPFRDVYEAFTIYTFFNLLINFLGGERSLILMMMGRPPVPHLWPLNHVLPKVDISDPHTFVQIKRGILQYVYVKPLLAIATVVCKATGTWKEGTMALDSGYAWSGLIYNVSIFWSLYDLALFWVCMSADLQPFRPMPKFLCIKGIIFASWWQGFALSILVWLGAITGIAGTDYDADSLAAAIQDALICCEMPFFALAQWYAFKWQDYADKTISDARMPIRFALRDAFGPRDLIEDFRETMSGKKYDYRYFDAEDNVIGHEESRSREARMREGMRYERGGRGKYWVPTAGHADSKQPLLSRLVGNSHARTMSPGGGQKLRSSSQSSKDYGTNNEPEETLLDPEEERLYTNARALEFGDWNYPVINTHFASREDRLYADPNIISQSTNRVILQSSQENRQRRKSQIEQIRENAHQGKPESSHPQKRSKRGGSDASRASALVSKGKEKLLTVPVVGSLLRHDSSDSSKSDTSQLVDLIVEDKQAEAIERVRARKEGGPGWNRINQQHFVHVYPPESPAEDVRTGFNPDRVEQKVVDGSHYLDDPHDDDDGDIADAASDHVPRSVGEQEGQDETGAPQPWDRREYSDGNGKGKGKGKGKERDSSPREDEESAVSSPMFEEERNAWGGGDER